MTRTVLILAAMMFSTTSLLACGGDEPTSNGCPTDTPATCGNGLLDSGEACDPGNSASGAQPNFGTQTCGSVVVGTSGPLQCGCCMLNTSMCTASVVGGTGG